MLKRLTSLFLASCFAAAAQTQPTATISDEAAMKRFIDAFRILEQNSADPINVDQTFYQGVIPGLLRHLDPHSSFFDPDQYGQLKQMEASTRKGFGTVVSILPGRVLVLQTLPNTPSSKAGMMPGDEILAVNNYRLDRLELEQIVELLNESKQKPVQLVVRHPGNVRIAELTLIPEEMQSSSVERAFELQPGVGYIRVASFEEKTAGQIREAIEKLGGRKLKGLVIDLRNNPGGLMTAALETASYFLKPNQVILSVKGRNVPEKIERVPNDNSPYTFPVAVLVNGKTASASEIVSGSLQDHDRAVIVGEPSFGKGLVQSVFPLSEGTGLALTTALYYIPSGRSIQKAFKAADFALGATAAHPNERTDFKTDNGRPVPGGGGIVPDIMAYPVEMTEFRSVLEGTGSFTTFAGEYVHEHTITPGWQLPPQAIDQFQAWLAARRIQPSLREWVANHDFVASRLKTEIYNLTLGVEKGDEVEAQIDPPIQKALEAVLNGTTVLKNAPVNRAAADRLPPGMEKKQW
jgi:carboxyl-terminal processing protease